MSEPIIAVLNCFTPATGANRAQVAVRKCGCVEFFGDESLARNALRLLIKGLSIPPSVPPPTEVPQPTVREVKPRRRPQVATRDHALLHPE